MKTRFFYILPRRHISDISDILPLGLLTVRREDGRKDDEQRQCTRHGNRIYN